VIKCDRTGYTTIPTSLSPEVQELVLSNNFIRQIDKNEFQRVRKIISLFVFSTALMLGWFLTGILYVHY